MSAIQGDGIVYSDSIPVSDDEYTQAMQGTITALIRIGAQGVVDNLTFIKKDEENQRPILVKKSYVTAFHGLSLADAQSQGLETVEALQDQLTTINNGVVGDSRNITVIWFQLR